MDMETSLGLSLDGTIIRFGSGLEDMLGYSVEDAKGRAFADFLPPESKKVFFSLLENINTRGLETDHRIKLIRKDGSGADVFVSVYPLRDLTGAVNTYMVLISTRHSAEVPPILSEEFQRMFMFSNDAVAVTDTHGNIIDVNRAFLDTYGYTREEALGQNPRILKSPHSSNALYKKMWNDILDPEKGYWKGEIINLAKDGREVPVLLSINAIKDPSGQVKNFLGIAFDMSGQKEIDRTRRIYIDYIVHDMRGPLTTIMANAELLSLQFGDVAGENMTRKLRAILDSSSRISNMAEDMLDYSRAQGGNLKIKKAPCSFAQILKSAATPFANAGKMLYLNDVEFGAAPVEDRKIIADGDKLTRVIDNLLNNSMKYAVREIRMTYEFIGAILRFMVSNDGKTISGEDALRIFEPFYQTADGVKAGGAGLGLSIVKGFVEAHGGRVWVEPGVKRGAAFFFTIPV